MSYPYRADFGECLYTKSGRGATVKGYVNVRSSEDNLISALSKAPVVVIVQANANKWQSYAGGILYDKNCTTLVNHAVS
jgi:hypothetical protein